MQAEAALAIQMRQVPARTAVPALLDGLAEIARRSGLVLDELKLRDEIAYEFYVELPFSLVLRGDYHALGTFVNELATLEPLVMPGDFAMEHTPHTDALRMTLRASLYRAVTEDHTTVEDADLVLEPSENPSFYRAAALRNPFAVEALKTVPNTGLAPEAARKRDALEAFDLTQLTMQGTLERKGQRWALIRDATGKVTRVGLGARLGRDHGRIVRITREHVDLIELVPDGAGWRERENSVSLPGITAPSD
jgi:type IV pilus assembly protein PilO